MLNVLESARRHFPEGYKLWIVLPIGLRRVLSEELAKLNNAMVAGKGKGLQRVVIQGPPHKTFTRKITELLESLYEHLGIHVDLTYSSEESRKVLEATKKISIYATRRLSR